MSLFKPFFRDIGIDLGTANSLVYIGGEGLLLNEPTVVALNTKSNQVLAVGDEAKRMLCRTSMYINVVRPLIGGVVSDFDMTEELLRQFLKMLRANYMGGFRKGVVATPDNLTEVERKSVEDAVLSAGTSNVALVNSVVAAALGAGLPISEPTASLIVDIGGGTTDVAVISMNGPVVSRTLKIAGDRFNEDISRFIKEEFRLAVGEQTAEAAKISVGSAIPMEDRLENVVRGRDLSTGLPREIILKNTHVRAALSKSLRAMLDSIREVIESTPPELAGDMFERGIYLCGGGALLRGLDQLIEKEVGVRTVIAEDPLTCVIRGLGKIVDNFPAHQALLDATLRSPNIRI